MESLLKGKPTKGIKITTKRCALYLLSAGLHSPKAALMYIKNAVYL
jgi:hypothetical protein